MVFVCRVCSIVVADCPGRLLRILLAALLLLAVSFSGSASAAEFDPYPLDPPDTSSPRATLRSFLANMTAAHQAYASGAKGEEVARPFRRAIGCPDLSDVAASLHDDVGAFSVLLLKEVLDRVLIPAIEDIPGSEAVTAAGPLTWRIPRTEIVIARVAKGDRGGAFLFSPRTVARLPEYYKRAKGLPYNPGATQGLLDLYFDNPGGMVPFNVGELLPAWGMLKVFERPIWKWGALVFSFCAGLVVVFALIEVLASILIAANRVAMTSARAHFIRIVMRLIGLIIAGYLIVDASAYLGWAVAPVLAGLGVGGLAMALAARPTLENVIANA